MTSQPRMSLFRLFRRKEDGSVAVEFALIIAPFLALVFGLFEVGQVLLTKNQISFQMNRVAREAALEPGKIGDGQIRSSLQSALQSRLDMDDFTIEITQTTGTGDEPDLVTITVTYLYEPILPLFVTEGFTMTETSEFPLIADE